MAEQYNTIHIFGFGLVQAIYKDRNVQASITKVSAEANAVINNLWDNKPADYDGTKEYHAINIFNGLFADWQPKIKGEKAFWVKFDKLNSSVIDSLTTATEAPIVVAIAPLQIPTPPVVAAPEVPAPETISIEEIVAPALEVPAPKVSVPETISVEEIVAPALEVPAPEVPVPETISVEEIVAPALEVPAPEVPVLEETAFDKLNIIETSGIVQLISKDIVNEVEISKILREVNNVIDNIWANKPIDYIGTKEYQEINITKNLVDWKINDTGFTLEFNNLDIVHIQNLIKAIIK